MGSEEMEWDSWTIILWRRTGTRSWVLWAFQFHNVLAISWLAEELLIGKACAGDGAQTQHPSESRQITVTAIKTTRCRLLEVSYPDVATVSTCVPESKACSVVSLRIYVNLLELPVKVKRQSTGQCCRQLELPPLSKFTPKESLLTSHSQLQSNALTLLDVESTAYLWCI